MKNNLISFFVIILIATACGGSKKSMKNTALASPPAPVVAEQVVVQPEPPKPVTEAPVKEEPIKEAIEKLIPIKETPPEANQYFVIIGSFRNYDNAMNYQQIIHIDGFNSVVLQNEKGLYRVSVLGTNSINEARNEIKRIRTGFPKHKDTWLLIQAK